MPAWLLFALAEAKLAAMLITSRRLSDGFMEKEFLVVDEMASPNRYAGDGAQDKGALI